MIFLILLGAELLKISHGPRRVPQAVAEMPRTAGSADGDHGAGSS
jgi:hypothetical protein